MIPTHTRGGDRGVLTFPSLLPIGLELVTSHRLFDAASDGAGARAARRWTNEITLADGRVLRFASVRAAAVFETLLASSPTSGEDLRLAATRRGLDGETIAARLRQLEGLNALPLLASLQALWILVFAPLLGAVFGFSMLALPLIAAAFALNLAITPLFVRAHRMLIPEDRFGRWTVAFTMLFSPPSAAAAMRNLSRPLLDDMHPAAVIGTVCGRDELLRYTRVHLADTDPTDPATALVLAWVAAQGITLEDLRQPPERHDPSCSAYCPRCQAQYVVSQGLCHDCDVPLLSFPPR